tara:strand:+ start:3452 stop:3667 length:216 start_codon:yes stop_codon:yes gene_type:complete
MSEIDPFWLVWRDFHCWTQEDGLQLTSWNERLYSTRQILKKLREQFPEKEWRSSSQSWIKSVQYRFKEDWF